MRCTAECLTFTLSLASLLSLKASCFTSCFTVSGMVLVLCLDWLVFTMACFITSFRELDEILLLAKLVSSDPRTPRLEAGKSCPREKASTSRQAVSATTTTSSAVTTLAKRRAC